MWPGPYGEWGGRKYLLASLDQSLKRMGLDYVDIFYSHRFDPETPLEETMGALASAVRQGKALYVGISSYNSQRTREAAEILKRLGTPCLIHQPSYSMLNRWIEATACSTRWPRGSAPSSSRRWRRAADRQISQGRSERTAAPRSAISSSPKFLTPDNLERVRALNAIAQAARPDARPDGARLGFARQARDLGPDRREPTRAGRRRRQGARQARASQPTS